MWEVNKLIDAGDLDPLLMSRGCLNVTGLLRIADEVCDKMFNEIGLGKPRADSTGDTIFTAAAHINSFQPIGIRQSFYVTLAVTEIGKKKFITKVSFHAEQDEVLAEVDTIHVCYNLNQKTTIEIPPDVLEILRGLYQKTGAA